ncbi:MULTISPECIES: hypothetical protein [unclassified Kitasatospora]|uniref:hypothetical protein n=1 Tax=unclassified Kitasatospora TaxID=2633591 RepID=UPI0033D1E5ED
MPEFSDPVAQAFQVKMRHQFYRLRAARSARARGSDYGGMSIELALLIGGLVLAAIGLAAYIGTKLTEKEAAIK